MKGENNIWKRWCLTLVYFSLVLPLYKNRPNYLLSKSVDWLLYNSNTGLNGKVNAWSM